MKLEIVEDLNEAQILDLIKLFSKEWWSYYRTSEDVRKMLQNTDLIIAIFDEETGQLIAFSRVLTDFVYRAMIYDVIVKESHRHQGLGTRVINSIIRHPALISVEHIELQTQPELISYYENLGFSKDIVGSMRTLRIVNKTF